MADEWEMWVLERSTGVMQNWKSLSRHDKNNKGERIIFQVPEQLQL